MCLIHTGPSVQVRATLLNTKGMIADILISNKDGLGVMYKNKRGLRIIKIVPKTLDEVTRLIDQLPQDDRQIAMHWRMQTHGDIDLTNCHPYEVVPGKVALMHNGILHTGNKADKTKSDTWHFIKDYLAEPMALSKDLAHSPGFVELLSEFIEDNRFVFMDDAGRMSIVNKDQGVEHDGMWFSNTYAWSPEMLIPRYRPTYRTHGSSWDTDDWRNDDWEDYYAARNGSYATARSRGNRHTRATQAVCTAGAGGNVIALPHHTGGKAESHSRPMGFGMEMEEAFVEAVFEGQATAAYNILNQYPFAAIKALEDRCTPTLTESMERGGQASLSEREAAVLDSVFTGGLAFKAHSLPITAADVICYYVNWTEKSEAAQETDEPEVPEDDSLSDDESANDGRELRYGGLQIRLFYDAGVWGYTTFGDELVEVDSGYGYDTAKEAMQWACDTIDAGLMRDEEEFEAAADEEMQALGGAH